MSKITSIKNIDYVLVAPGYTHRLLDKKRIETIQNTYFDFFGIDVDDEEEKKENDDLLFISYHRYNKKINKTPKYKDISSKKKDIEYLKTIISKYKIYPGCVAFMGAYGFNFALLYAETVDSVDFCGGFSPKTPFSIDYIEHLGKNTVVLYYDTESG